MSTVPATDSQTGRPPIARTRLLGRAVTVAILASVLNGLITVVFMAAADFRVQSPDGAFRDLTPVDAMLATLVPALIAAVLLTLLLGRLPRTVLVMQILGTVLTLLSLVSPFGDDVQRGQRDLVGGADVDAERAHQ